MVSGVLAGMCRTTSHGDFRLNTTRLKRTSGLYGSIAMRHRRCAVTLTSWRPRTMMHCSTWWPLAVTLTSWRPRTMMHCSTCWPLAVTLTSWRPRTMMHCSTWWPLAVTLTSWRPRTMMHCSTCWPLAVTGCWQWSQVHSGSDWFLKRFICAKFYSDNELLIWSCWS